jgi:hypothetical protein
MAPPIKWGFSAGLFIRLRLLLEFREEQLQIFNLCNLCTIVNMFKNPNF